ncbi:MAG: nucleotidyltransferase family protein [Novosphingobium sp.]|nr:nucleotidyltransferase family protein [Novosphingobium sp.]
MAIVLAAGLGERFGGGKLAAGLAGRRLLDHAVAVALASPAAEVIVVARPGTEVPADPRIRLVTLASAALSDSLRVGLAAAKGVNGEAAGALIFLGDMPLVPRDMGARLIAAIGEAPAALPEWRGKPGHPVLLARSAFTLAHSLAGDEGLGRALRGLAGVVRLQTEDEGVVLDVDRAEDLADIARRLNGS